MNQERYPWTSVGTIGISADSRIAACRGCGAGVRGVRLRLPPVREERAACAFDSRVRRVRMLRSVEYFLGAPLQLNMCTSPRTGDRLSAGDLPSAWRSMSFRKCMYLRECIACCRRYQERYPIANFKVSALDGRRSSGNRGTCARRFSKAVLI